MASESPRASEKEGVLIISHLLPNQLSTSPERFPEGVRWLFIFQSFNAINFTIAMGSPMILLIRFLGGSELHVGIVIAIPALMVVLQLISSRLVERLGYRGSMMVGWGLRSLLLLFIVPLPLLVGQYSPEFLLGVLIAAQLGFNIIRGLTSGAWFPWLSQLIPESIRGKYIGI
ncbi:MAG: MFS transporter [Sumerlaeia bacterium]